MTKIRGLIQTLLLTSMMTGLSTAHAEEERDKREERRALKMSDMDQVDMAQQYREEARAKNLELIEKYEQTLRSGQIRGEQKATVMFRLAERYFDEGRYHYFKEMESFQAKYDECFNTPGCNLEKMVADNSESTKWQEQSIRLYEQILTSYPNYTRADEVLFYLGTALLEIKKPDQAVRQFMRLTKNYSQSTYLPSAYIAIGEYWFERNDAYKALQQYQKATRFKNSPKYGFATYKLAWCYYNVNEYDKAIDTMKSVVSYSQAAAQGGDKNKLTLYDEALKDLVRFFADAGEMNEAYDYFSRLGKKELIYKMLKRLGRMYFEQGKFEQAIETYRRLITEEPQSPAAPDYQNEIIQAYRRMGAKDQVLSEIDRLLRDYGKSSSWARANSADQDAVNEAARYVEKALREVALGYHQEARKLGTGRQAKETYILAEKAYRKYVVEFPSGKYTYDMRFSFGEILWELKNYPEAYEQYLAVVKIDPQGKHSKQCAEDAIFAAIELVKIEEKEGKVQKRKGSTDIEPKELSDWEQKLLSAMDSFTATYPDSKDTTKWLYESGELLFSKNLLDKASERYQTVIAREPRSKQAKNSAKGIVDALAFRANAKTETKEYELALKDWKALQSTANSFNNQEGLGNAAFKKEMFEYYEIASAKLVEVTFESSSKGDSDKITAANGYTEFAKTFPASKKADVALNLAAIYYYETNRLADSMDTRATLIATYPKSKFYSEHIARLGYAHETIADYPNAIIWYERLFNEDKDHEFAKDAMYTAIVLHDRMGEYDAAISGIEQFMKTYPGDERVKDMPLYIARIHKKSGDLDKAGKAYYTFFAEPPKSATEEQRIFARLQYGKLLKEQGVESDRLLKYWKTTMAAIERAQAKKQVEPSPQLQSWIAEIRFDQAMQDSKSYTNYKIKGPKGRPTQYSTMQTVKKQVANKTQGFQDTEKRFTDVVELKGGVWTIAAIVEIGKAADNYADSIYNSYVPYWFDQDQTDMWKMRLEDQAYVYNERAVEYYQLALQKAYESNIYNDYTAYAVRRLGELRPNDYPEFAEIVPENTFLVNADSKPRTYIESAND